MGLHLYLIDAPIIILIINNNEVYLSFTALFLLQTIIAFDILLLYPSILCSGCKLHPYKINVNKETDRFMIIFILKCLFFILH